MRGSYLLTSCDAFGSDRYVVIKRLCLIGGAMLFGRYLIANWDQYSTLDYTNNTYASTEWLRGEKLCTFRGNYHLAWSVPMVARGVADTPPPLTRCYSGQADPTYVIPGAAIHSFCMFAPFFALYEKKGMVVQGACRAGQGGGVGCFGSPSSGIFLFLFGPYLAGLISPNLMEQASIWCFFSIAQIAIMLFFIRETLITNWGKNAAGHVSLVSGPAVEETKKRVSSEARSTKKD